MDIEIIKEVMVMLIINVTGGANFRIGKDMHIWEATVPHLMVEGRANLRMGKLTHI